MPNRAQQPQKRAAHGQKPEQRAEKNAGIEKHPELAAPRIEGVKQKTEQKQQAVERVKRAGQAWMRAADGAEDVIGRGQGQPKRERSGELRALERYGQFHQPKRRERKPPPARWSSS